MIGQVLKGRYRLESPLGKGGWSEVFEATDLKEGRSVVLKMLARGLEAAHVDMPLLFEREAVALLNLSHDHIVRILDFGEDRGLYFITMEHDLGISLYRYLCSREWPSIPEIIGLTIQLGSALQYVHGRGMIHQDLKPSNIILKGGTIEHCKIADFGSVLLKHLLSDSKQQIIMGTYPYISPEQLGAHGSRVDARSDLYALGVVFYELLSGIRPVPAETAPFAPTLHGSVAIAPPSQANPLVPQVLDRIVLKLLQYDPDARYQTSSGLLEDLLEYQRLSTRTFGSPFFRIGKKDDKLGLPLQVPLIGREREIGSLQEKLREAGAGKGAFALVGGEAGSGKSRLVEELIAYARSLGCIHLTGKCSESYASSPYFPLIQIFHDYLETLATLPRAEAQAHHRILQDLLSQFVPEISALAPAMVKHLVSREEGGVQDPTTRMPRFLERIGLFFSRVAERTRPLVLVFEDIHWADSATYQLLRVLGPMLNDRSRVLVIATYRTEEAVRGSGLRSFLQSLPSYETGLAVFRTAPLPPEQVEEFVARILPKETPGYSDLLRLLTELARGNPLFILEFLRAFLVEGILAHENGAWTIRSERMKFPAVGTSLAEIILRRLARLSDPCKTLLATACCIGRSFSRSLLVKVLSLPERDLSRSLEEAVQSRLVLRRTLAEDEEYTFTHDTIYETFYEGLDAQRRSDLHLHIARTLEEEHKSDLLPFVFALAYHFRRGKDDSNAFHYSLLAGEIAKDSLAMQQAAEFYELALELLGRLPDPPDLERDLREKLADACSFIGEYDKALENYERVVTPAMSPADRAMLERKIGSIHFRRGELPVAIEHFTAGIKSLGGGMARGRAGAWAASFVYILGSLLPLRLRGLKFRKRAKELRELVNLYYASSYALFWVDINRAIEVQMRCRYLAALLGDSYELARAHDATAVAWAKISLRGMARLSFAKGRRVCDGIRDDLALGNHYYLQGLVRQWAGENRTAIGTFQRAIDIHERIGALFELELAYTSLAQSLRQLGELDESCDYILKAREIAESVKDYRGMADAYYQLAVYFYMSGSFSEARQSISLCFEYADKESNPLLYSIGKRVLGQILLKEGRFAEAIHTLEESKEMTRGRMFFGEYILDTDLSLAETYLRQLDSDTSLSGWERRGLLSRAGRILLRCRISSLSYRNFLGPTFRLRALLLEKAGRRRAAMKCYERALRVFEKGEQRHELAGTKEELAQLLRSVDGASSRAHALRAQGPVKTRGGRESGEEKASDAYPTQTIELLVAEPAPPSLRLRRAMTPPTKKIVLPEPKKPLDS